MKKKTISALLAVIMLFTAGGCQKDARFGVIELNRRIRAENKNCCFNEKEMFYSDRTYYVFYSLRSENDILLTMREDDNNDLDRISVSLSADDRGSANDFISLSLILARIFIPDCDTVKLIEETGLDRGDIFTKYMDCCEQGRYTSVLFGSDKGVCFFIERS